MKILFQSRNHVLTYDGSVLFHNNDPIVSFSYLSWKFRFSRIRILSRLFRLEPRCATMLNDDIVILAMSNRVFLINVAEKRISKVILVPDGLSTPLNLTTFNDEYVYWGDYGMNRDFHPINIYRIDKNGDVKVLYTFPANTIFHIHNILFDKWNERFFILTGDFGDNVGIYTADLNFTKVVPFLVGNEQYRAVQGMALKDGFLWATDAVLNKNHIYYVSYSEPGKVECLSEINGSVIYGCNISEGLLLSTTVEPYPSSKSFLKTILDDRIAPGVVDRNVYLLHVDKNKKISILGKYKKDCLPMQLFQYGQITFPYYDAGHYDTIQCNGMAIKKFDGKIIKLSL